MDRLRNCLPFKNLYSSHYSTIIKKILTRYLICNEVKKNASKAYYNQISKDLNLKGILGEFDCLDNVKADLRKGYQLFQDCVEVLGYAKERGLDTKSSPMLRLFDDAKVLLTNCFKELEIIEK